MAQIWKNLRSNLGKMDGNEKFRLIFKDDLYFEYQFHLTGDYYIKDVGGSTVRVKGRLFRADQQISYTEIDIPVRQLQEPTLEGVNLALRLMIKKGEVSEIPPSVLEGKLMAVDMKKPPQRFATEGPPIELREPAAPAAAAAQPRPPPIESLSEEEEEEDEPGPAGAETSHAPARKYNPKSSQSENEGEWFKRYRGTQSDKKMAIRLLESDEKKIRGIFEQVGPDAMVQIFDEGEQLVATGHEKMSAWRNLEQKLGDSRKNRTFIMVELKLTTNSMPELKGTLFRIDKRGIRHKIGVISELYSLSKLRDIGFNSHTMSNMAHLLSKERKSKAKQLKKIKHISKADVEKYTKKLGQYM